MITQLKMIALSVLMVFAPIKTIILAAFVMIMADLITGIIAAKKRGESVTSAGFSRTMVKTMVYQTAIIMGFLTETYLTGGLIPVSKIITSYIGLTEITSIIENLNSISGGSLMKALVDKLASQNSVKP